LLYSKNWPTSERIEKTVPAMRQAARSLAVMPGGCEGLRPGDQRRRGRPKAQPRARRREHAGCACVGRRVRRERCVCVWRGGAIPGLQAVRRAPRAVLQAWLAGPGPAAHHGMMPAAQPKRRWPLAHPLPGRPACPPGPAPQQAPAKMSTSPPHLPPKPNTPDHVQHLVDHVSDGHVQLAAGQPQRVHLLEERVQVRGRDEALRWRAGGRGR
jgi:hypothetical protein